MVLHRRLKKRAERPIDGAMKKSFFDGRGNNVMFLVATITLLTFILLQPSKIAKEVATHHYYGNLLHLSIPHPPWKEEKDNDINVPKTQPPLREEKSKRNHTEGPNTLPPWKQGYLDIHHIHAGANVATFMILPDGTTVLIDSGDLDIPKFNSKYGKQSASHPKLGVASPYPNSSKTTGQWVTDYIHHFWPPLNPILHVEKANDVNNTRKAIDILLITHFKEDHIGSIYTSDQEQKKGTRGDYILTGIAEVGDEFDFTTIIDRGYPKYDFPIDLEQDWENASFLNYLKFVRTSLQRGTTKTVEKFEVGSDTQIGLRKIENEPSGLSPRPFGRFLVRNIKANLDYSYAERGNNKVNKIPGQLLHSAPDRKSGYIYDENKLSTAIVVEYGKFRYYEGGDQEYHNIGSPPALNDTGSQYELDTVTPTAKMAGPVHVATLNHHGHGVLEEFCALMSPKVVILQGWCTDQPPNHSIETLLRQKNPAKLFATWVSEERIKEVEKETKKHIRDIFKSTVGHVVIRVEHPPPRAPSWANDDSTSDASDQEKWHIYVGSPRDPAENIPQKYHVYVLDESRHVKEYFGPYEV